MPDERYRFQVYLYQAYCSNAELDVLNTLKRQLRDLPEASLTRILGGNCIRFYGLDA